ncbi:MAG: hypothetical protein RMJ86_00195 [Anaerolineae bacterium]|nr:hypothetical protein [Thermoflexales bacterium]MDW8052955.1 hypothetical protein [Anaerolineae bacterium]
MLGVSSDTLLQVVLGSGVVFGLLSLAGILIRVLELNFYGVPLSALDLRSSAETYSKGFLAIFTLCFILLIFVVSILLHLYPLLAPSGQGMTATPSEQSAMVKPPKQTNVWAEVALTYKPLTCFVLLAFLVIQASYPDPGVFLSRGSQLPHVKRSWYILPLHWMRYIFSRWNTALMCQSIIAYILTLLFLAIQTYVAAIFLYSTWDQLVLWLRLLI